MKCGDSLPRELRCLWVERGYVTVEPVAAGRRLGTERNPAGRTAQTLAHLVLILGVVVLGALLAGLFLIAGLFVVLRAVACVSLRHRVFARAI